MRGVLISLALILTTSTAVADQTGNGPAGKPLPKLVLFMVIDGFPQEQFVKYYDQYTERYLPLERQAEALLGGCQPFQSVAIPDQRCTAQRYLAPTT
jgi:hypothetical protein